MSKNLLIVFVKNIKLGKVKTRLAKTIGNQGAFEVYSELVKITEKATQNIKADKRIYFSDAVINSKWTNDYKTVQIGNDLGERMKNAFIDGFNDGYKKIVLIGSDLPDISSTHIKNGFDALDDAEVTFGTAEDGGYYLLGLSDLKTCIFDNKPWSKSHLLHDTLLELKQNSVSFKLLETLNDIDTFEDLEASSFYKNNKALQTRIQQLND